MARTTRRSPHGEQAGSATAVQETGEPKYAIDFDAIEELGRSASVMLSGRLCGRCEACMKFDKDNPAVMQPAQDLMKQIATKCSREPAYLLPGTPVTEAVFRLMLASSNRPMTLAEIQGGLTQAWASVIYLKNLSDDVVRRMLEQRNEYYIGAVEGK